MRNKYALLFKNYTDQSWEELRKKYPDLKTFREFIQEEIPYSTLRYYDAKFHYKSQLVIQTREIGKTYGQFTVISYVGTNNRRQTLWECECNCGRREIRSITELHRTRTNHMCKECQKINVSKRFLKDYTGLTINKLFIRKRIGSTKQGNAIYECECLNCGNVINISSIHIPTQLACGCLNSKGEFLINKLLNELQISYKTQFKFIDCKNDKPLKFDFAIFENNNLIGLIEFQGKQHYSNEATWPDYDFESSQKRDSIKRNYCKDNNIPLVEIPYYDYNKINKAYLLNIIQSFNQRGLRVEP